MFRFIISTCLLASVNANATEVYRSVDEYGRPVYSNTPPQGQDHKVVDIEVQNDLGTRLEPSDDTQYFKFQPSTPDVKVRRTHSGSYYKNKSRKLDMSDLQAKCESYRNASNRSGDLNKQREKRDYWCGRLNRGK